MKKITILSIIICVLTLSACSEVKGNVSEETTNTYTYNLYYTEDCIKFLTKTIETDSHILSQSIIEELKKNEILDEEIKLMSFDKTENSVTLNFSEEFLTQLCRQGTSGEYYMIGSVVNTFLDAYDVTKVTILVNNDAFESGHVFYNTPLGRYE